MEVWRKLAASGVEVWWKFAPISKEVSVEVWWKFMCSRARKSCYPARKSSKANGSFGVSVWKFGGSFVPGVWKFHECRVEVLVEVSGRGKFDMAQVGGSVLVGLDTQRAQYCLIKEYTLNYTRILHNRYIP